MARPQRANSHAGHNGRGTVLSEEENFLVCCGRRGFRSPQQQDRKLEQVSLAAVDGNSGVAGRVAVKIRLYAHFQRDQLQV